MKSTLLESDSHIRGESAAMDQCEWRKFRFAYVPFDQGQNAYTLRMREILATIGQVEPCPKPKDLLKQFFGKRRTRVDAVFLNWVENTVVGRSGLVSPLGIGKLLIRLALLKRFADKVILVRHNVYPHHTRRSHARLARRIIDHFERLCDTCITHSGAQLKHGRWYCPFPLYRRALQSKEPIPDRYSQRGSYFVAFGRIEPYKQLDQLIEHFPANQALLVFGAARDEVYVERLQRNSGENIRIVPGFVAEDLAQRLVSGALAIVIANADEDMVVSASLFYGLSLGVPVYALETPFVRWISKRLPVGAVSSSSSLKSLCAQLQEISHEKGSPLLQIQALKKHFGDDAIRGALVRAIGPHSKSYSDDWHPSRS